MKKSDVEKIINEARAKIAEYVSVYIENEFSVRVEFSDWKKFGKDRTYINIKIMNFGSDRVIASYDAGFINNETNRYSAKNAQVNIQKKDFSYIENEFAEKRAAEVAEIEKIKESEKREAEEKKADTTVKDFEKIEEVAEVAEGTVVIAKRNDCYVAMLKNCDVLKKLSKNVTESASMMIVKLDIEDYMKAHAPKLLESASAKCDEFAETEKKEKEEKEEREAKERRTLKLENICECADGEMIVGKQFDSYFVMLREKDNNLKRLYEYNEHDIREDCLYDIYDYLDYHNYNIPESLENYA